MLCYKSAFFKLAKHHLLAIKQISISPSLNLSHWLSKNFVSFAGSSADFFVVDVDEADLFYLEVCGGAAV